MTFTHVNPEGVWDDARTLQTFVRPFQGVLTEIMPHKKDRVISGLSSWIDPKHSKVVLSVMARSVIYL